MHFGINLIVRALFMPKCQLTSNGLGGGGGEDAIGAY